MSRGNEQDPERREPPYYTLDTSLFTGTFAYFRNDPVVVRGKAHTSEEPYRLSKADQQLEPIATTRGTRTYFHLKPFVLVPDIRLTVELYDRPRRPADQPAAIGTVTGSQEAPKPQEIDIGHAQAWYYPHDNTIVLWECYLYEFVRKQALADTETIPLPDDPNMRALWHGFEQFLRQQCDGAARITTPYHDPIADTQEEYQQFLGSLGYSAHPTASAAWSKTL